MIKTRLLLLLGLATLFVAAAYFLPWFVAGYFFLKLREVAK